MTERQQYDTSWKTKSIGELGERLDGLDRLVSANLKSLEMSVMAMDRRWSDLAKAQEVAFGSLSAANQKAIDAAFLASNTAIAKAENYNDEWKRNSNEWKEKFMHLQDKMVLEVDLERRLNVVFAQVDDVRKMLAPVRSMGDMRTGHDRGKVELWQVFAVIATLVIALLALYANWKVGG